MHELYLLFSVLNCTVTVDNNSKDVQLWLCDLFIIFISNEHRALHCVSEKRDPDIIECNFKID